MICNFDEYHERDMGPDPRIFFEKSIVKSKKSKTMPCSDWTDPNGPRPGITPLPPYKKKGFISKTPPLPNKAQTEPRKIRELEAALCAIISELDRRKIAPEILVNASKDGEIDLVSWWATHKQEDEIRLRMEFNKFSAHERELLKKLIANKKL